VFNVNLKKSSLFCNRINKNSVFFSVRGATKPEQCQHGLSPLCLYVVLGY